MSIWTRVSSLIRLAPVLALCLVVALGAGCKKKTPDEKIAEIGQDMQEQKYFEAKLKAQEFIEEHPDSERVYDARAILAQISFSQMDFDECYNQLQVIEDSYGEADTRSHLAFSMRLEAMSAQGKTTEAITLSLAKADDLTSFPMVSREFRARGAGLCIQSGQYERSREIVTSLLDTEETTMGIVTLTDMVIASHVLGDEPLVAVDKFTALLKRLPGIEKEPAYENIARMMDGLVEYFTNGEEPKPEQAIRVYRAFLDNINDEGGRVRVMVRLSATLRDFDRGEEGKKIFEEAREIMEARLEGLKSANEKAAVVIELISMHNFVQDHAKAIAIAAEFLAAYPTSDAYPNVAYQLWLSNMQRGDFAAAIVAAENLKAKFPDQGIAQQADNLINQSRQAEAAKKAADEAAKKAAATSGTVTLDAATTASAPAVKAD